MGWVFWEGTVKRRATGLCVGHLVLCLDFPTSHAILHDPAPASPLACVLPASPSLPLQLWCPVASQVDDSS